MHAREWGGSDICIKSLQNLISSYQSNAQLIFSGKVYTFDQVCTFMEGHDIFVFLDVNPDGKNYSQKTDTNSSQRQFMWWLESASL
ncbi:hypothetical protein JDS78_27590 [Bacillus cereus group sp. N17]|nr:hypothetical protein [Bacillus cereus group sp. N17]TBX55745.1 hypothetical protein E0M28_29040 [Bacillus toyonensis]HDR7850284.1 hypothetical protein [Bacillus toyonensis]